jgi:hypothetical protein
MKLKSKVKTRRKSLKIWFSYELYIIIILDLFDVNDEAKAK